MSADKMKNFKKNTIRGAVGMMFAVGLVFSLPISMLFSSALLLVGLVFILDFYKLVMSVFLAPVYLSSNDPATRWTANGVWAVLVTSPVTCMAGLLVIHIICIVGFIPIAVIGEVFGFDYLFITIYETILPSVWNLDIKNSLSTGEVLFNVMVFDPNAGIWNLVRLIGAFPIFVWIYLTWTCDGTTKEEYVDMVNNGEIPELFGEYGYPWEAYKYVENTNVENAPKVKLVKEIENQDDELFEAREAFMRQRQKKLAKIRKAEAKRANMMK